ncbi:hypothetical protein [Calothrix sp. PCC 6303]|uniref:hypothetical protein n=1 Tax=Calothrix sp. PCC 6303 TaxID=1170562 RepID=UPI0002A02EBF|nr:hypothetical protein [Calothrix sp. PCC 6303]AFZ02040.1 hypothetical protein Cal6303_3094 [Calothrix sp. PCC 6303]
MSPLKRRQFGKLAAAGLTSTILADVSKKAIAQNEKKIPEVLYGVNLVITNNGRNREDQTPSVELNTTDTATERVPARITVPSQAVENPSPVKKKSRAFFTGESDRVTKLITSKDGNLITSTVSNTRNGYFNHLLFTVGGASKAQFRAKKVLDLDTPNQTIESLLSLSNEQILCLVANEGVPPFTFKTIDFFSGKILAKDELALPPLPPNNRFANLCQDPKGNIFATEISADGIPFLIFLNLQDKAGITGKVKINKLARLTFEGRSLSNDVKDLNFSPSGQLYALAADKSGKSNALFTVDVKTGKMALVREFAFEKFTFAP